MRERSALASVDIRMAEQGVQPTEVYADAARIQDRAAEQTELARQISQALHVRDMPRAQQLIEDGADLFGHSSMVAAVAAQARQDGLAAMDARRPGRYAVISPRRPGRSVAWRTGA